MQKIKILLILALIYVIMLVANFCVAMIPAMILSLIIKQLFVVEYTFWQISFIIALIITVFGKGVKK